MRKQREVIEDAIEHGTKLKAALLSAAGEPLTAESAAALLAISYEDLKTLASFLAVWMSDGQIRWPSFQFESQIMIDAVPRVLATIGVEGSWPQLSFCFLHMQDLGGRTPVQAIREGDLDAVIVAACHFGEHGAS